MIKIFGVGVQRSNHHITANLITGLFRALIRDSAPRSNAFGDIVLNSVARVDILVILIICG